MPCSYRQAALLPQPARLVVAHADRSTLCRLQLATSLTRLTAGSLRHMNPLPRDERNFAIEPARSLRHAAA